MATDAPPILDNDGSGLELRANQVGYVVGQVKGAYLMAPDARDNAEVHVVDDTTGGPVWECTVGAATGAWSSAWPFVYPIDFTGLETPGTFHLVAGDATSEPFQIGDAGAVYAPLVANSLAFLRAQRDGSDVDASVLRRAPSHLDDAQAAVYATPTFDGDDALTSTLTPTGQTVDVAGGWFDAGDYLKFVETASYVEVVLLVALRGSPSDDALRAEATRGAAWLDKMWNDGTKTLLLQVGVGDGNDAVFCDHDIWRLPETDDGSTDAMSQCATHRPVFLAAAPGAKLSPNLAGRMAAEMALASSVLGGAAASARLTSAQDLLAQSAAATDDVTVTALPFDFYGESDGADDLELGGAEVALALEAQGSDASVALGVATTGFENFQDGAESFNLYEVNGLAHVELAAALGSATVHGVAASDARAALEAKLGSDEAAANADPFGFAQADDGDPVPHALGVAVEALLSGEPAHAQLAQRELAWALGANAWGTSFVVGAGTTFPRCLQHQVANLVGDLPAGAGSAANTAGLAVGATVDGFTTPDDLGSAADLLDGMTPCSVAGFAGFDSTARAYRDDVVSFDTSEPADDYTVTAMLAFYLASR